MEEMHSMKKRY
jgi:superfamily II DNA/RNA helicase